MGMGAAIMACLAAHGSNRLDFFCGTVGKVAWVGVLRHGDEWLEMGV